MRPSPIVRKGCPRTDLVIGHQEAPLRYVDGKLDRGGVAWRTYECECCGMVWLSEERLIGMPGPWERADGG